MVPNRRWSQKKNMMDGDESKEEAGVWGKRAQNGENKGKSWKEREKSWRLLRREGKLQASGRARQSWKQINHKNKLHREAMGLSPTLDQARVGADANRWERNPIHVDEKDFHIGERTTLTRERNSIVIWNYVESHIVIYYRTTTKLA